MPFFRFLLLLIPLLELAGLILLGQAIGVGMTLLWVLVSGLLGIALIQRQGWAMVQRLQVQMAHDRSPFAVLRSGFWGVLAGVLLMFPGVITDALAIPCLLLAWRSRGQPAPGEPGGPQVWQRGGHTIIEGEWEAKSEAERRTDRQIGDQ